MPSAPPTLHAPARARLATVSFARLLGAVAVLAAQAADAQPARADSAAVLFRQVRLFDGERVHAARDVLVTGGRVAQVAPRLVAPAGATVIDGRGRTLLPGLIDAHVHAWGDAPRTALAFGVTTELDMFTDHRQAATWRAEQRDGRAAARADVLSAGTLVTAPGGHGTEYGMPIPTLTSADSAQAFVDARLAEGSDWIKIVLDDGHLYGRRFATLDTATLRATIAAARRRDRLAVVHVGDLGAARTAVDAGASGLAHLMLDSAGDARFAALMKRRGTFAIPTLSVLAAASGGAVGAGTDGVSPGATLARDPRVAPFLTRQDAQVLGQVFPIARTAPPRRYAAAESTIRALRAAGVPILAGTDAGNPGTMHGAAMHLELELLVKAGLTPVEALRAATSVPARAFALADRGRVAAGQRADLVLVDGDPTTDVTATRAIVGVWKAGVPVDRAWRRQLAAAAQRGPAVPTGLAPGGAEAPVSDFDDGTLRSAFGAGWAPSNDAMAGGDSQVALRLADGALEVHGTVGAKVPYAWAGAMFSPGPAVFAAADLSGRRALVFRVRADVDAWAAGGAARDSVTLRVMAFAESRGQAPLVTTVTVGRGWREVALPFAAFGGMDGKDVMAFIFSAGPAPGAFRFALDDVRLR